MPEQSDPPSESLASEQHSKNPSKARILTLVVLGICLLIFIWYLQADRFTPYTDQARVNSLTVPIVSQVPGYLSEVRTSLHDVVNAGDTLFVVDRRKYEIAVNSAEASVDQALQNVGTGSATVKAAAAQLGSAKASLDRAQRNFDRTQNVIKENPGALSQADRDRAETNLQQAVERVAAAEANLEKAKEALGETGPNNATLRQALAQLEAAQLDLEFASILAPYSGVIESFNVDVGYFTGTGSPIAILVAPRDVWVQANMTENNIGQIEPGDPVELSLDVAPGRIFKGTVRSVGYGVSNGQNNNRGQLPSIGSPSGWLRDPQRFPVIVGLNMDETKGLRRVGGQADVIVYTGDHGILNAIGRLQIRLVSWLSYVR